MPLFQIDPTTPNLMPSLYREVSVADVDSLVPADLVAHFSGREVYRHTRFMVARHAGNFALVELSSVSADGHADRSKGPLFSVPAAARMLADASECSYHHNPSIDCGIATQMASAAQWSVTSEGAVKQSAVSEGAVKQSAVSEGAVKQSATSESAARVSAANNQTVRCVIVEGRYCHFSFILNPTPLTVEVVDIVPPTPSKLVDQVRRVLEVAEELPPVRVIETLIDSRELLAKHNLKRAESSSEQHSGGCEDVDTDSCATQRTEEGEEQHIHGCEEGHAAGLEDVEKGHAGGGEDVKEGHAAGGEQMEEVLLPCRGAGVEIDGVSTSYLDQRPAQGDWKLLGCARSHQIHAWFYGAEPEEFVETCPRRLLDTSADAAEATPRSVSEVGSRRLDVSSDAAEATPRGVSEVGSRRLDVSSDAAEATPRGVSEARLRLSRCCLLDKSMELQGSTVWVPWGATLAQVRAALGLLTSSEVSVSAPGSMSSSEMSAFSSLANSEVSATTDDASCGGVWENVPWTRI